MKAIKNCKRPDRTIWHMAPPPFDCEQLKGMNSFISIPEISSIHYFTWHRTLPGFSVHFFQARILEQVASSYSRGLFPTQGLNSHLLHFLRWQADSLPWCHLGSIWVSYLPYILHIILSDIYFAKCILITHFSDELESWSSKRLRNLLQVPNSEAGMLEYRLRGLISRYLFFPCIISLCDGGESFGKLLCGVKALVKTFLFFSLQDIQNLGSVLDFSFTGESPFC